ncbi:AmpG family muropeptide MFS transporter [Desulfopila sp. IMCC35006]|uniref:AmpG family muropeptide MFS transporter n=1 Tax=Desulfopila sp. IMCC35006 TaxID=2569542 RepID=UPI0010AC819F|nr:MFS transporter [Desulfopila sp. IMCC35006]TKB26475.1 AmpG family muropeptide MFS transporter [Desulfopila sp. IMCC35006]
MRREVIVKRSWGDTCRAWLQPQAIAMLFLGFSAGLPILLIFSTLSVWLREAGIARSAVTFFSWAALGYSFKFLWAPLVDLLPLPVLTRVFGRRRAWLLVAQLLIVVAIVGMALIDPAGGQQNLTVMALAAVMLGFSSATQDIVIDAYRIESAEESLQALLAAMYIAGYRVGMLVAGAGSLFLAGYLGTTSEAYNYGAWELTYLAMAAVMCCGVATTLLIEEPKVNRRVSHYRYSVSDYGRFLSLFLLSALAFALTFFFSGFMFAAMDRLLPLFLKAGEGTGAFLVEAVRFGLAVGMAAIVAALLLSLGLVNKEMVRQTYLEPIKDFFVRYGTKTALLLLVLIGCYRLSDIVLGVVSNVFYLDMGFSKNVIAGVTKTFGLGMTLAGGFLGGMLTVRFGVNKILFLGAFLSAATNLLFMLLASTGQDVTMLTVVIGADNLSAGIATTAFIAFLSSLTNISFTAVQYAIFSSMMTLCPKLIGGYSGTMVSAIGYERFFLVTATMGIPVLFLVVAARKAVGVERP